MILACMSVLLYIPTVSDIHSPGSQRVKLERNGLNSDYLTPTPALIDAHHTLA